VIIEAVDLHLLRLPLVRFFHTRFGRIDPGIPVREDGIVAMPACPGIGVTTGDARVAAHARELMREHA
jgi:hypothetical protein